MASDIISSSYESREAISSLIDLNLINFYLAFNSKFSAVVSRRIIKNADSIIEEKTSSRPSIV